MINKKEYKQLKETIQKANTEINRDYSCSCCGDIQALKHVEYKEKCISCRKGLYYHKEEFRLAVIFLALINNDCNNRLYFEINQINKKQGKIMLGLYYNTRVVWWNLKDDNLDNQSDETKQFLINILVK